MTSVDGLAPEIVDAHLQQWSPRRTPWSASRLSRLYRLAPALGDRVFPVVVPKSDRDYVLTPRTVARAYEPGDYVADVAGLDRVVGARVDAAVVICAHWSTLNDSEADTADADVHAVDEVRYALDLPFERAGAPSLGALVVHGNPRSPRFGVRLERQLEMTEKIRGVRVVGTRHPDQRVRQGASADGVIVSAPFLHGMQEVAERDLVADVFVYSHQLYDVVLLAREFPDTTVVVEHFGTPVGIFGPVGSRTGATAAARADIARLWRERISTLAAQPNVVIKLSGLALPLLGYGRQRSDNIGSRETLADMIGPLVGHVVARFGAERVMFGSNFPIDKPNASVSMIAGALHDVLAPWGDAMVHNVFCDTARRVYRID